jgi:hypothetical protein
VALENMPGGRRKWGVALYCLVSCPFSGWQQNVYIYNARSDYGISILFLDKTKCGLMHMGIILVFTPLIATLVTILIAREL